jgi:hypothetical protein
MAATADIASQTAAATGSDLTVENGASIQIWTYPALVAGERVSVWRVSGGSPEDEIRAQDGGRPIELGAGIQIWTYPALVAGERVSVWRVSGGSPEDEIRAQDGGRPIELGAGINSIALTGPGTFRLKKSVTATATVVYYDA